MKRSHVGRRGTPPVDDVSMVMAAPRGDGLDGRAATCMEARNSNPSCMRKCNRVSQWVFRMLVLLAIPFNGSMILNHKFRKPLLLVGMAILAISFLPLSAHGSIYTSIIDDVKYLVFDLSGRYDEGFATIAGYVGNESNVYLSSFPDTIDFYGATLIGHDEPIKGRADVRAFEAGAFKGNENIIGIALPSFANTIIWNLFQDCKNFYKIDGSEKVGLIYEEAFSGCVKLRNIDLTNTHLIGQRAFQGCTSLEHISLPNAVHISDRYSCSYRYQQCFMNCSSLRNVEMPKMNRIYKQMFQGCSSLTEIDAPLVTIIDESAFYNCTKLDKINFRNIHSIGSHAFNGCSSLKNIDLTNVETIGTYAFSGCHSLVSVDLSKAVKIEGGVFNDCISLESIKLHNVEKIDRYAFANCKSLRSIVLTASTPPEVSSNSFSSYNANLIVPESSIDAYKSHPIWGKFYITSGIDMKLYNGSGLRYGQWQEVKGVTADGVSQIALLLPEGESGNNLHIQLSCKAITSKESELGTVSDLQQFSDGLCGYIFTAPVTFAVDCGGDSYTITATVIDNESDEPISSCDIKILRPGVILLHGLNSSSNAWKLFKNRLFVSGLYADYSIENVDYSSTNKESFEYNIQSAKVVQKAVNALSMRLLKNGIVSTKYDFIGHSMGGILTRLYAQDVDNSRIHKIVTVNTPHFGSNLASLAELSILTLLPSWVSIPITYNTEAVRDLMPISPAMRNLSDGASRTMNIPIHALGSFVSSNQTIKESNYYWVNSIIGEVKVCEAISEDDPSLSQNFIAGLLGSDKNDFVVTLESQLGGLSGVKATVLEDSVKAIHTNVTEWTEVNNELITLLKEPASSEKFSTSGFSRLPVSHSDPDLTELKQKKETSIGVNGSDGSIKIASAEVKSDSLQYISLQLSLSENISRNVVFSCIDDERMLVGCDTTEYRLVIPEDVSGQLKIYAIARTSDAKLLVDSCFVDVEGPSRLAYIRFNDRSDLLLMQGQTVSVNTESVWSDGITRSLVSNLYTDNNEVLEIIPDGIIGRSPGECKLFATYGECVDSINVKVINAPVVTSVNMISEYAKLIMVKANRGNISITACEDLPKGLELELYAIDGTIVRRERNTKSISAGETVNFTIPESDRRAYLLRVGMHDRTEVYKIFF